MLVFNRFIMLLIILSIISVSYFINCKSNNEPFVIKNMFNAEMYNRSLFLDVNNNSEDSLLRYPFRTRIIPNTHELVVLDIGKEIITGPFISVFSPEGNLLYTLGELGQAPGELMRPCYINVDKEGDIYVYDYRNNRISIYSNSGNFINCFNERGNIYTKFSINDNNEIIMNLPQYEYYISVISREGTVLRNIGKIEKRNDDKYVNQIFAYGYPFMLKNKYYIFLDTIMKVKVYDNSGFLISDISYLDILQDLIKPPGISSPEDTEKKDFHSGQLIYEIVLRNNKFFLLTNLGDIYYQKGVIKDRLYITVLNEDLEQINTIILPFGKDITFREWNNIEIIGKEEHIIYPLNDAGEILLFTPPKNR